MDWHRKIDDGGSDDWYREQAEISERMNREHLAKHDRSFYGHLAKLADERERNNRDPGNLSAQDGGNVSGHRASQIADLLVEAGSRPNRSAALDYLMHSPHGAALLHRMSKKETIPMKDTLEAILKDSTPVNVCKAIVARDRSPCGEHELVAALTKRASELRPELRPDQAFSKLFEAEESVRRACAIAKSMPFLVSLDPVQVGGEDAQAVNDPAKAIEQLKQLGRDRWPTASAADQFERALTAPENHKLARVAVPIPRPTTIYQMPHR
jgi:hypothetical protein